MGRRIITLLSLFTLTIRVNADFYDIFQNLQPFLQNYQTTKPDYSYFGAYQNRPEDNRRYDDTQTYTQKPTNKDRTTVKPQQRSSIFNIEFLTTPKTVRKTKNNSSQRNEFNRNKSTESNNRRLINNNNNYNTEKATTRKVTTKLSATTKSSRNYNTNYNSYTTRPGVKPAVVHTNRPPITNKPPTTRPYAVYPRPTDSSVIRFPEDEDTSPEVMVGPDEDKMSSVEKRRYIDLAEKMCDKYKSLNVKKVEAIPLLPSPEPVQLNVSVCPPSKVPLVVGGKVVSIEEFPHMALLGWSYVQKPGYSWKCGGSLISDQYVLTAGHCAYQEKDDSVVYGAPRAVQLGSSYLDDTGALVMKVLHVVRHPKYIRPSSYYDIALVKMVKPVTFSQVVKPACLGEPPGVGEPIIATGWGRTEFGGTQSLELRSVSVPIWDMDECKEVLGVSRKMPYGPSRDSQICAGTKGKDTCQGDSGGPAQIQDGCVWRVVAVTSVGRSCGAPNTPALYATLHRAFIAAEIFGKTSTANLQTDLNNINNPDRNNNGNGNKNNHNANTQANGNNNAGIWSNQHSNNNQNTNVNTNNNNNWNSGQPNTNSNGNWNSNKQNSNSPQANTNVNTNNNNNWNSGQPNTNNNGNWNNNNQNSNTQQANKNGNTNNNWNSGQPNTNNNGNWNNNNQNSNTQQANKNGNTNNNWNSGQPNTNNNGVKKNNNQNSNSQPNKNVNTNNNNWNANSENAYQNSNINSNNNRPQNYNTHSGYNNDPKINVPNESNSNPLYNYNNNNKGDEIIDYYDNIRFTTKRPSYNDWFNYGF